MSLKNRLNKLEQVHPKALPELPKHILDKFKDYDEQLVYHAPDKHPLPVRLYDMDIDNEQS